MWFNFFSKRKKVYYDCNFQLNNFHFLFLLTKKKFLQVTHCLQVYKLLAFKIQMLTQWPKYKQSHFLIIVLENRSIARIVILLVKMDKKGFQFSKMTIHILVTVLHKIIVIAFSFFCKWRIWSKKRKKM